MKQGWITGMEDISAYLGICRDTLYAWNRTYEMPIQKIGGKWCAIPSLLDEWLKYAIHNRPPKPTLQKSTKK